jgi:hypothetical protein
MKRDQFVPGDTIRFQVQDHELGCGSSWSLATRKETDDIYLNHREGSAWMHSSAHHSGTSQYTLTDRALVAQPDQTRHFAITHEDSSLARGMNVKMSVIVPHSSLQKGYKESVRNIELIEVPICIDAPFDATRINIIMRDENLEPYIFRRSYQIAGLNLASGKQLIVMAEPVCLGTDPHEIYSDVIEEVKRAAIAAKFPQNITRFVLGVHDSELPNAKVEMELAVTL